MEELRNVVKIGTSDYTREQMESGNTGWELGTSSKEYLETIAAYEDLGYKVKFETNFFRRIGWSWDLGLYKVIAYLPVDTSSMAKLE